MSNSLKIFMIVFSIIIGNIIFYNFQPQEKIVSINKIIDIIKNNITYFEINNEKILINSINVDLIKKQELSIDFYLQKNIDITTKNKLSIEKNVHFDNLSSSIILKNYNSIMDIENLNFKIKEKIDNINLSELFSDININHIYRFELANTNLKIIYSEYNIKLTNFMLYLSMFFSLFGLVYGLIFILKFLDKKDCFEAYKTSIKLLLNKKT